MAVDHAEFSAEVQACLDDAACGLLRTDADGLIVRVNSLFCVWLGFDEDALVGRRRFQDLLTMGGRIFYQTHWYPLLQIQGSVSEVKLELQDKGGKTVPFMVNAIRRTRGGSVVHDLAMFVARDRDKYEQELVRSRKRLEELVAKANRLEAEAKDRALFAEQMMGIVSHDLRNPLSTIQLGTVLLQRTDSVALQQRTLTRISSATERAVRLLRDLLDFTASRMGQGLAITKTMADVHAVAAEAMEELLLAYPGRTLAHVHEGQGLSLVDPDRFVQALVNLVSNAVSYGAPDRPITITTVVEPASTALHVHNHGRAIPPETQAMIFRPMTRGTLETTGARSVGLGLFIVSEIAKAHGGAVSVSSSADTGTIFILRLPGAAAPAA